MDNLPKWENPTCVELPFINPSRPLATFHWRRCCEALHELLQKCKLFKSQGLGHATRVHGPASTWLGVCISHYNVMARCECNFDVVQTDGVLSWRLLNVLPQLIEWALKLPSLVTDPIPKLTHEENRTLSLSRRLVCSLLANAFFCTFPGHNINQNKNPQYINFCRLFNAEEDEAKTRVKREKLKCFLQYFEQMSNSLIPNTPVQFERKVMKREETPSWKESARHLAPFDITVNGKIEDCPNMLQVDFANRRVGGGVLGEGTVQEEILFCIYPELVVSRLFTERLACNEVLEVRGVRRFNDYLGYSDTFTWKQKEGEGKKEGETIVAMDAIPFGWQTKIKQYRRGFLERELNKCFVAFRPSLIATGANPPQVATGNWGCGSFNGDPQWKMIIQWMAASECGRRMYFHARDDVQKAEMEEFRDYLLNRAKGSRITVGNVYEWMLWYAEVEKNDNTVFQFIKQISE